MNYDDETLMAYADGELDESRTAEIAAALARDPVLARRVEDHRALRAKVGDAFAALLDQPVPERLAATVRRAVPAPERGEILKFPARTARAPGASWQARHWGAMAASLLLGGVISWAVFNPADPMLMPGRNGALVAEGALARALDEQLASHQGGGEPVLIGLTFRSREGSICRSFALRQAGTAGLACRIGGEWRIPVTAGQEGSPDGLRQAAAPPPPVLQAIEARISGEALDAAAEASARSRGWDDARP